MKEGEPVSGEILRRSDYDTFWEWWTAKQKQAKAQAASDKATVLAALNEEEFKDVVDFHSSWIFRSVLIENASPILLYRLDQLNEVTKIKSYA